MSYKELIGSNFKINLVDKIENVDLSNCSISELHFLKRLTSEIKAEADALTLEDELVGYTYNNLDVLSPKIASETAKRKTKTKAYISA